jgi:hypothetical protein
LLGKVVRLAPNESSRAVDVARLRAALEDGVDPFTLSFRLHFPRETVLVSGGAIEDQDIVRLAALSPIDSAFPFDRRYQSMIGRHREKLIARDWKVMFPATSVPHFMIVRSRSLENLIRDSAIQAPFFFFSFFVTFSHCLMAVLSLVLSVRRFSRPFSVFLVVLGALTRTPRTGAYSRRVLSTLDLKT